MSKIEWTDATWNPFIGCRRVSPGCQNCYAEGTVHRGLAEQHKGLTVLAKSGGARWNGNWNLVRHRLDEPLRRTKPRMYFVNSLSDLFYEPVGFPVIAALYAVMGACPQHTFQVLTKRPKRALEFFEWMRPRAEVHRDGFMGVCLEHAQTVLDAEQFARIGVLGVPAAWPLPNVWLGVSVEDQGRADERIPLLLQCPAAVRWVSYEPALGPVTFTDRGERFEWLPAARCHEPNSCGWSGGLAEAHEVSRDPRDREFGITACPACGSYAIGESPGGLDWIVVGGESGPGARAFDLAWARSTVAQCRAAGVPVFVKQLGALPKEYAPDLKGEGYDGKDFLDLMRRPRPPQMEGWTRMTTRDRCWYERPLRLADRKGGNPDEWPEDVRVREWPDE